MADECGTTRSMKARVGNILKVQPYDLWSGRENELHGVLSQWVADPSHTCFNSISSVLFHAIRNKSLSLHPL